MISMFSALSAIISVVDKILTSFIFPLIPMIKLGMSNIIIMIYIYKKNFQETIYLVILKSIIIGLFYGSIITFMISIIASIGSYIVMYIIYKISKMDINIIILSVLGGIVHILIQLLVIKFIYKISYEILLYGYYLFIISIITSIIVGLISKKIIKMQNKYILDI